MESTDRKYSFRTGSLCGTSRDHSAPVFWSAANEPAESFANIEVSAEESFVNRLLVLAEYALIATVFILSSPQERRSEEHLRVEC